MVSCVEPVVSRVRGDRTGALYPVLWYDLLSDGIGIDADFEFFQENGGSVNNTVADIENVMNATAEVYEDLSISITHEISILIVRTTSSDPYETISVPVSC